VPPRLVWPSSIISSSYICGCLHLRRKVMPYFFHIFLRQRRNPSSTAGRADLLLPVEGNCCHHCHRILLGIGEHLHHPQHEHHLHLEILRHPLIVSGRSNPGYCLRVVCMFVLANLSFFYGEVILIDCVVPHTPLIMIMFDTFE
jgi:hypothetical protein